MSTQMRDAALNLALRGFSVIPLCAPFGTHGCTHDHWETHKNGHKIGKTPVTVHGYNSATKDAAIIKSWFNEYPTANVGMAVGRELHLFCLEADMHRNEDGVIPENGMESLGALEAAHGVLPKTLASMSGSGGEAFFFRYPPGVTIHSGKVPGWPGLEIKADGGIVVAPSRHACGGRYEWIDASDPANAPQWLIDLIATPAKGEKIVFPCTDLGNAERFAHQHYDTVRWCHTWNSWMIFNDKYWEQDTSGQVDRLAKNTVRSMYAEAADEEDKARRQQIAKHAQTSESNRSVRAMLDRAKSELPATPDQFNTNIHLLNTNNGTLDLRTGQLHPHRPEDMLTRCLKIDYTPTATCPTWHTFTNTIFAGNEALIAFVQQALGMAISGDTSEQCLFLCHGGGSNGKTTLLEAVRILLASYALSANIETFMVRKSEHISNDVAELYGARLVTAEEATPGGRLNEAFIKKATGKQPLRARRLHENEFEFMPEMTIFMAVNHKPVVKDTSKAMWRRVHFIPFTVTIESDQADKHLGEKLLQEAEGILAWLVAGCMQWYQQGRLNVPGIVREATAAYREEQDVVARFIEECCMVDAGEQIGATALYKSYKEWCEDTGERWDNQKTFGTRLSERGHARSKTRVGIFYQGLKMRSVNDVNDVNDKSDKNDMSNTLREKKPENGSHHSHHSQSEDSRFAHFCIVDHERTNDRGFPYYCAFCDNQATGYGAGFTPHCDRHRAKAYE